MAEETKTAQTDESIKVELPDGNGLSISIKANQGGIAINIRYGKGSQNLPGFGVMPQDPHNPSSPTAIKAQAMLDGGGDGGNTC